MEDREIMLTEEGYKKLVDELQYLKGPRTKNEQALLETKIAEMEATIRKAKIVADNEISTKEAGVGTQVTVYDYEFEEEITYSIVGATEVNIAENKISNESPVGKAMMGKKKGEDFEVETPAGVAKYKIVSIKRL